MSNRNLSEAITSSFHLWPQEIKSCRNYFILYWESRYLFTQLLKSPRIIREGVTYTPIFLDGLSPENLGMNPEMTVRLSFRRLVAHKTGYVLISKLPASKVIQ